MRLSTWQSFVTTLSQWKRCFWVEPDFLIQPLFWDSTVVQNREISRADESVLFCLGRGYQVHLFKELTGRPTVVRTTKEKLWKLVEGRAKWKGHIGSCIGINGTVHYPSALVMSLSCGASEAECKSPCTFCLTVHLGVCMLQPYSIPFSILPRCLQQSLRFVCLRYLYLVIMAGLTGDQSM